MKDQSILLLLGAEGIKQVYKEILKSSEQVDSVCYSQNYDEVLEGFFEREYSPKLGSRQTREILPDTTENKNHSQTKDKNQHAVKFLKNDTASESDITICNNFAVLISFNKISPFALLIRDKEIVTSFKMQFKELWERL